MMLRTTRLAPSHLALVAGLGFAWTASPALAETAEADAQAQQPAGTAAQPEDDVHNRQTGTAGPIIVSASGLKELDVLAGTSVLEIR
ncbi:MAG: TonB-dependent receptor, partial [Synechococcales cyanobacterium RM1_1_8]|nr:TonB-dependent receptor [Synechococcales cyanobacterium RM1_1_8]